MLIAQVEQHGARTSKIPASAEVVFLSHQLHVLASASREPNPHKHRNMLEDIRLVGGLSEQMFV